MTNRRLILVAPMLLLAACGSGAGSDPSAATATLVVPSGDLVVTPQPVDGLLGTAGAIEVTVAAGGTLELSADYDIGIR